MLLNGPWVNLRHWRGPRAKFTARAKRETTDIWLKLFCEKFNARCDAYINAMKDMSRQIPQTIKIALTPKQKVQKLMTDIGGGWYMEKLLRDYHH